MSEQALDISFRRKANISDLARDAGVSTATVDRVLNRRGGVRLPTVHRVLSAADRLGYELPPGLLAGYQPRPMRLAFVLPQGANRYLQMMAETIGQSAEEMQPYNVECHIDLVTSFNPKALADRLLSLAGDYDGVAFMALEHPLVREAVVALHAEGIFVLTLISDLSNSPRAAFVGMDNRAAGRTAGLLLGRFIGATDASSNKVAMFAGSLSYRGHEEREMGFRHILAESFPELEVIGLREGQDDPASNYVLARALLEQHPDLVGIYNVGGASEGIARALAEARIINRRPRRVAFIGHGLTRETRAALVDGAIDAIINVPPEMLMRSAARIFCNLRDGRPPATGIDPIPIGIFLRENLP
jgi:LacI family transcriptional regulator